MKTTLDQLLAKKNPLPIYWISGDEPFLLEEARSALRGLANQMGFIDRECYDVDHLFNWNQFIESTRSLSLFSTKSLIELNIKQRGWTDETKNQLAEYGNNPSPDKLLIITSGKMEKAKLSTKWFKAIEENCAFIQIWPIPINQLPIWIRQELQKHQLSADSSIVKFIADYVEGNLLSAKQTIAKLALLFPNKALNLESVTQAIHDSAHFDVFTLIDSALLGNTHRTARIFTRLKQEGVEPAIILWALAKEIRLLLSIQTAQQEESNLDLIFRKHGVWDKRKPMITAGLRRHNIKTLYRLLQQATNVDMILKGASNGNLWLSLNHLTIKLCGVTHGR